MKAKRVFGVILGVVVGFYTIGKLSGRAGGMDLITFVYILGLWAVVFAMVRRPRKDKHSDSSQA